MPRGVIATVVTALSWVLISYLAVAFVMADWNAFAWGQVERGCLILICLLAFPFCGLVAELTSGRN